MSIVVKKFKNKELGSSVDAFIDSKQNIYFKGSQVAALLGYEQPNKAIIDHVPDKNKKQFKEISKGILKQHTLKNVQPHQIFINECGLYRLIMRSKLPNAKRFQDWVRVDVLPSIRKYGHYCLYNNPKMVAFKIEDEYDLHTKVAAIYQTVLS